MECFIFPILLVCHTDVVQMWRSKSKPCLEYSTTVFSSLCVLFSGVSFVLSTKLCVIHTVYFHVRVRASVRACAVLVGRFCGFSVCNVCYMISDHCEDELLSPYVLLLKGNLFYLNKKKLR